ncbi:MAG TPA: hypothetical protein VFB39_02370 [Solirubrobacteraceae bacterium]|nr:hypothetical protein [Solirubrobacteraceae bacterium]
MNTINRPIPNRPAANVNGSAKTEPNGRPSAQLILDGVIASYIHDISERHRYPDLRGDRLAVSGAGTS